MDAAPAPRLSLGAADRAAHDAAADTWRDEGPAELALAVELDGRRWRLPVDAVREVVRWSAPTPVPGAPSWMLGLVNVRGTVVTVVDGTVLTGAAADGAAIPAGRGSDAGPVMTGGDAAGPEAMPRAAGVTARASDVRGAARGSIVLLVYGSRSVGLAVDRVIGVVEAEGTGAAERDGPAGEPAGWLAPAETLARLLLSSEERAR